MKNAVITLAVSTLLATPVISADSSHNDHDAREPVSDSIIAKQREALANNTKDKGFGPQSPRDIDLKGGNNGRTFNAAPAHTEMHLCNIHFHKNAEHKGG